MVGFKEIQKSGNNNEDFSQQKIIALVSFYFGTSITIKL